MGVRTYLFTASGSRPRAMVCSKLYPLFRRGLSQGMNHYCYYCLLSFALLLTACRMEPQYLGHEVQLEEESEDEESTTGASKEPGASPGKQEGLRVCRPGARKVYAACLERCPKHEEACRGRCRRRAKKWLRDCLRDFRKSLKESNENVATAGGTTASATRT